MKIFLEYFKLIFVIIFCLSPFFIFKEEISDFLKRPTKEEIKEKILFATYSILNATKNYYIEEDELSLMEALSEFKKSQKWIQEIHYLSLEKEIVASSTIDSVGKIIKDKNLREELVENPDNFIVTHTVFLSEKPVGYMIVKIDKSYYIPSPIKLKKTKLLL